MRSKIGGRNLKPTSETKRAMFTWASTLLAGAVNVYGCTRAGVLVVDLLRALIRPRWETPGGRLR